jgi:hypothetical protein
MDIMSGFLQSGKLSGKKGQKAGILRSSGSLH